MANGWDWRCPGHPDYNLEYVPTLYDAEYVPTPCTWIKAEVSHHCWTPPLLDPRLYPWIHDPNYVDPHSARPPRHRKPKFTLRAGLHKERQYREQLLAAWHPPGPDPVVYRPVHQFGRRTPYIVHLDKKTPTCLCKPCIARSSCICRGGYSEQEPCYALAHCCVCDVPEIGPRYCRVSEGPYACVLNHNCACHFLNRSCRLHDRTRKVY